MSQFSFSSFPRSLSSGLVLALAISCLASPAWAGGGARTDDDDPTINMHGVIVNNILAVLRSSPDSAGDACLKSLTDMHKAQDQLDKEETAQRSSDIGLVRDVLESDMEGVISSCGSDAHKLCEGGVANQSAKLNTICAHLPETDSGEGSDDLQ